MVKLSRSISLGLALVILSLPCVVGCGGSGGGTVPKTDSTAPEPQRIQRGVTGAGEGAAKPLGN